MEYVSLFKNKYYLLTLVFIISFTVHLIGINKMGRTWDESFKVDAGKTALNSITSGDFSVDSWQIVPEHPMVGKYAYGLFMGPGMIRIDDGKGYLVTSLSPTDMMALTTGNYIKTQLNNRLYMISYDYTMPRVLSAFFNSMAVTLTVLLALFILSEFWALMAGIFMLLVPRFVAMGQLVTFESISVFLFVATLLVFYKLLNKPKDLKLYVLIGILCGLLFWTRYNNYFIFIFLGLWMGLDYYFRNKKEIFNPRLFIIPVIAFILGILIWPYVWNDFPKYLLESFFFHKNRIIPSLYYLNRIIFTTPIPILIGLVLGIFFALREKKYWNYFFVFYFLFGLFYHMIIGVPGGGTRFVFIIYPSIGVLCALGYSKILKKNWIYLLVPIIAYMIINMFSYYPYYLDYYNSLIGGVQGARAHGYEFSWWGEGQKGVGDFINKNAPSGASVGYFVVPRYVAPATRLDLKNQGFIDDTGASPDFVMVSSMRIKEFEDKYKGMYEIVYSEKVKGEDLVVLMRKK